MDLEEQKDEKNSPQKCPRSEIKLRREYYFEIIVDAGKLWKIIGHGVTPASEISTNEKHLIFRPVFHKSLFRHLKSGLIVLVHHTT